MKKYWSYEIIGENLSYLRVERSDKIYLPVW